MRYRAVFFFALAALCGFGCSVSPTVPIRELLLHRAVVDPTGLASVRGLSSVRVTCAPPRGWNRLVTQRTALFTHEQWRSPTRQTAVGAIYVRLPLPLRADAVAWFAKREYRKNVDSQKAFSTTTTRPSTQPAFMEWRDSLGRPWFDGEDGKYHVRGYVVVDGLDAWFVYTGYRLDSPENKVETAIARRSAETFVPAEESGR